MDQTDFANFYVEKLLNSFIESQKENVFLKANIDFLNKIGETIGDDTKNLKEQLNECQVENQKQKEKYEVELTKLNNTLHDVYKQLEASQISDISNKNKIQSLEKELGELKNSPQKKITKKKVEEAPKT